jgi:3-methyladenine DNA glycosylase AlkD
VDVSGLVTRAEHELRAAGTSERAEHEKRYLKSSLEHAGTSLPVIRAIAKQVRRDHRGAGASDAFRLADALWHSSLHERRMLAVMVLEQYADTMGPADLHRIEPLLRDSSTWAYIDGLAGDVAASIVLRHPTEPLVDATLRGWADDANFWLRRSALLAHLDVVGRTRAFHGWNRLCQLADVMLDEREFFIRKAIGWVLRQAGKRRPDLVVEFVQPRISRVSGVTIREAVRYLDPADRDALMVAYQANAPLHRQRRTR